MKLGLEAIKLLFSGIVFWVIYQVVYLKDTQIYECDPLLSTKTSNSIHGDIPLIYVITATYNRLVQRAELTRLSNAFRLVKRLHWIVVEHDDQISLNIQKLLNSSGIIFTYFAQEKSQNKTNQAEQKNDGLDWIMTNHNADQAVVYFADDDNSYDIQIFEEMRYTKKLSMWPVAFSGGRKYETPIVDNGKLGKVVKVKFPIDMAGFAINVGILWKYHPMRFNMKDMYTGFEETKFLEQCCTLDDIEPRADNCTKIMVWHTRTVQPKIGTIDHNVTKLEV